MISDSSPIEIALKHIYDDPATLSRSIDPFTVTTSNGFMPLHLPETDLPSTFKPVIELIERMPVVKLDGSPGLLASFQLGPVIDLSNSLPDLTDEIEKLVTADGKPNLVSLSTAFREYAFLASAYLLEPCWERQAKSLAGYGLGRQVLCKQIAGPLVCAAKLLDIPPFMAYAASYCLNNFRLADPAVGLSSYSNLRLIRAFERGLDPASSEAGFVLTHVDMVKHSSSLVRGALALLTSLSVTPCSRAETHEAYNLLLQTMAEIDASMEKMWAHSKPGEYLNYRTFIFGITNQSMFPHGVIYEGQYDEKPQFFRGESGANDSMIPLLDALLQITFPVNPLTDILVEFRDYRPAPHRAFLAFVRDKAQEVRVREESTADPETAALYLCLVEKVLRFRWRHWTFAREYILRRTAHPTATGGSPIVNWLPNQLFAVMEVMDEVWAGLGEEGRSFAGERVARMMEGVSDMKDKLQKEVGRWCVERSVAE